MFDLNDFDLDEEIQAWCEAVHPRDRERQARIDELADHLHCEVERLMGEGLSKADAFMAATNQVGDSDELSQEHSKNRGRWGRWSYVLGCLCRLNSKALGSELSEKERASLIIVVSLFFAGAMVTTSFFLRDSEHSQTATYMWIAIWWVPYSVLSSADSRECGKKGKGTRTGPAA